MAEVGRGFLERVPAMPRGISRRSLRFLLATAFVLAVVSLRPGSVPDAQESGTVPLSDSVPPVVNITSPVDGTVVRKTLAVVSGIASDEGGDGLRRVEARVNGGAWSNASDNFGPNGTYGVWSVRLSNIVPGPNVIEARAWDEAGNPSATASVNLTLDPWDLTMHIGAEKTLYAPSDRVNFTMETTNRGNETARLEWDTGCTWDYTVVNTSDVLVFDSGSHGICALASAQLTVQPGETVVYSDSWSEMNDLGRPVPVPDCFSLSAAFRSYEYIPEEPAIFSVAETLTNTPPHAAIHLSPGRGDVHTTFVADASDSFDCEDSAVDLEAHWDWQGDGVWDTVWSVNQTSTHQYGSAGEYAVQLQVRDRNGSVGAATTRLSVDVLPDTLAPQIVHVPPVGVRAGERVEISALVTDDRGIGDVTLEYRDGVSAHQAPMIATSRARYAVQITAPAAGEELRYDIVAVDTAGNVRRAPAVGDFAILSAPAFIPPSSGLVPLLIGSATIGAVAIAAAVFVLRVRRSTTRARGPVRRRGDR